MYRDKPTIALRYDASRGRYVKVQILNKEFVRGRRNLIDRFSPLSKLAARRSRTDVFKLLINSLHHVSQCGSVKLVQRLVNKGVALDKKDFRGSTPLMLAAKESHREVAELLINLGADIHCCSYEGWTLMHYASHGGSVEIVQCLVSKEVVIDKKDFNGKTPLMLAAVKCLREVVEVLINSGADIHCCDDSGATLLHYGTCGRSVEIVQYLINKGVALDKKAADGRTPLHSAVKFDAIEITHCLLNAGADCNLENDVGESPFNLLIKKEKPNLKTILLCIEKGAYVNSTDYNKLMEDALLKKDILQDVKPCSQAVINKFNNKDLHLLYKRLASTQKLPHIDRMKIGKGSGMALEVEKAVTHEIQAKGFCDIFKMVPLVLGILCVKCLVEKSFPAFNGVNLSESQNGSK